MRLRESSPAIGRTLAQLNLRAITGATVLAIVRHDGRGLVPSADGTLQAGDVLALAGTHEALDSARQILGPDGATDGNKAGP